MAALSNSVPTSSLSLTFEPDLFPLLPTAGYLDPLLKPSSHLTTEQKRVLTDHSIRRGLVLADLPLITYILHDENARRYLDLNLHDEDGRGVLSLAILCFGSEDLEREVETEECVRLLLAEGADMVAGDHAGWTPLHYAALVAPPTLISYLLSHCPPSVTPAGLLNCSTTRGNLTALDVITAHSPIPGREGVALMLEEAMGFGGSAGKERMKRERREAEAREKEEKERWAEQRWNCLMTWGSGGWGEEDLEDVGDHDDDDDDDIVHSSDSDDDVNTSPALKWDSMLAFPLPSLPTFLHHIITQQPPILNPLARRSAPAHTLWLCARYAVTIDEAEDKPWLDELILGALTRVEKLIDSKSQDIPTLSFWAYNLTLLTCLLRCDTALSTTCDSLEHFEMFQDLLHNIYVWVTRVAEERIEPLLDAALLDHSPLGPSQGFDQPEFEDDWTVLKGIRDTFKMRRSPAATPSVTPKDSPLKDRRGSQASLQPEPITPMPSNLPSAAADPKAFADLRKALSRPQTPSSFRFDVQKEESDPQSSPKAVISLLSSLLLVLRLYALNPAYIIQVFSQIFFWMSCELFNRVLNRKKHLSRSRAMQIRMNISALEDWARREGLPSSIVTKHFEPLNQLLQWLQCLSQIDNFANLVATVQTMRRLNPLQMRKAVRDYRYEVNESHMSEECTQYLAQLQRDWERRRLQLGREQFQKPVESRSRDGYDYDSEILGGSGDEDVPAEVDDNNSTSQTKGTGNLQESIDSLFDPERTMSDWTPPEMPSSLGELMNTRQVLPLVHPSNPRLLAAVPLDNYTPSSLHGRAGSPFSFTPGKRPSSVASMASISSTRSSRALEWKRRGDRAIRDTWTRLPAWVDSGPKKMRWEWDDYRGNDWLKADADEEEVEDDEVEEVEDTLLKDNSAGSITVKSSLRTLSVASPPLPPLPLEGLPSSNSPDGAAQGMLSTDSSLRTPSLSVSVDLQSPAQSPTPSRPPSPTEIVENIRRTGSTKSRRKWRTKRREGSDITLRPEDQDLTPLAGPVSPFRNVYSKDQDSTPLAGPASPFRNAQFSVQSPVS